ncbi:hypothetical protein CFC21_037482, partial [Triticum aestivum]
ENLTTYMVWA